MMEIIKDYLYRNGNLIARKYKERTSAYPPRYVDYWIVKRICDVSRINETFTSEEYEQRNSSSFRQYHADNGEQVEFLELETLADRITRCEALTKIGLVD